MMESTTFDFSWYPRRCRGEFHVSWDYTSLYLLK